MSEFEQPDDNVSRYSLNGDNYYDSFILLYSTGMTSVKLHAADPHHSLIKVWLVFVIAAQAPSFAYPHDVFQPGEGQELIQ